MWKIIERDGHTAAFWPKNDYVDQLFGHCYVNYGWRYLIQITSPDCSVIELQRQVLMKFLCCRSGEKQCFSLQLIFNFPVNFYFFLLTFSVSIFHCLELRRLSILRLELHDSIAFTIIFLFNKKTFLCILKFRFPLKECYAK